MVKLKEKLKLLTFNLNDLSLSLLILLILLIGFIASANSIIDIKILELKFYVNKEQLLNYELSGKVLREKIKNILIKKDDYMDELRNNILESAIMNSSIPSQNESMSFSESIGYYVVNLVRFISFSEKLTFVEDSASIYKIQYGFYLERSKKFSQAIKIYEDISKKYKKNNSNENGFVLLHLGFCYAMTGSTDKALEKLYTTEEIFSGTQFADYARLLINVLIENNKRARSIDSLPISVSEKANLYYENGRYQETIASLDKIENRNSEENFIRARSFEELGNVSSATEEYIKLIEKKDNQKVVLQANRRVYLIGKLYENNKDLTDYSENNARKIGDEQFIKTVESASNLIKSSTIIEKLSSPDNSTISSSDELNQLNELKNEFSKFISEKNKESENISFVVQKINLEKTKLSLPDIVITLIDGRSLTGEKIILEKDNLIITKNLFTISIPIYNLYEISLLNNPDNKFKFKYSTDNNIKITTTKFIVENSNIYAISEDGKTKLEESYYEIIPYEINE